MDEAEVVEWLESRRNQAEGDRLTQRHTYQITLLAPDGSLGNAYDGEFVVEYVPDEWILPRGAFEGVADQDVFRRLGEEIEPEEFVSTVYHALVTTLYPGSDYLDDPWERLPLVVELTAEDEEGVERYDYSLGRFPP